MTEPAAQARRAFLVGLREDGSPTCHPMVALEKDGAPAFSAYRKSVKVRNFERDPRAAVILLDDWQAPPANAQLVTGVMEEIDSLTLTSPTSQSDSETLAVPQGVADRAQARVSEGKRLYLRLRPDDRHGA